MLYGGFNKVENGQLTGEWQWGVDFADLVTARANGWFPDLAGDQPAYDPITQSIIASRALQGDVVAVTYTVDNLPAEQANANKRADTLRQLAATDAEFSPRWIEDLAVGHQYSAFVAWATKRANLRTQLVSIPSEV